MAGSSPPSFNKTHFLSSFSSRVPPKPPKSKFLFARYVFSKSLIIILVLLVFSFFPSQVPEFFKKTTIITKFWELIYLLVIGIAICYGLFSTKIDSVHSPDESAHSDDNIGTKETYLSGISYISSIFEDRIQNPDGFDEKDLFEECRGSGSRYSEIGNWFGKSDGKKVNQYFLGESMVVINDEKYVLEQLGKPNTIKQNNRLCLPVRNLGSKSLDSAAGKSIVEDYSSGWDGTKKAKFRGLVPIKLEDKFKESDSRSPLNWRSKSMRLEKPEDMCNTDSNETSDFSPVSVGLLDFEGLKLQSMRFSMPYKMNNSSEKEELKQFSENEKSKCVEANHGYRKPYLNGETSSMESKPRESSTLSFSEMNNRSSAVEILKDFCKIKVNNGTLDGSFKEILKDFGKTKVYDDSNINAPLFKSKSQRSSIGASSEMNVETLEYVLGKEEKADVSKLIQKPATIANAYKKGKSVRTNRPKEQVHEAKVKSFQSQTDDKVETKSKPRTNATNVKANELSDSEQHSGEVDRKAEEFIAKFREQIRLQKVASARKLNLW